MLDMSDVFYKIEKPIIIELLEKNIELRIIIKSDYEKPYGGGNPYYYCKYCERSMIEVSYDGHYKNCKYEESKKELISNTESINHHSKDDIKLLYLKRYIHYLKEDYNSVDIENELQTIGVLY
jgi:hypothetical protein